MTGTWDFIFNNPLAISLYLLHNALVGGSVFTACNVPCGIEHRPTVFCLSLCEKLITLHKSPHENHSIA